MRNNGEQVSDPPLRYLPGKRRKKKESMEWSDMDTCENVPLDNNLGMWKMREIAVGKTRVGEGYLCC